MNTEALLGQFEDAWRSGQVPDIQSELDVVSSGDGPLAERQAVAQELIMIDLWHRWQRALQEEARFSPRSTPETTDCLPRKPALDDYAQSCPVLLSLDSLPPVVIGEEYRARQRFGDAPTHQEYATRFPSQWADLKDLLADLDSEALRSETRQSTTPIVSHAPPTQIGKYLILDAIDRGGQATVFRGVHPELRCEVAIKLGHPTVRDSAEHERLVTEARLLVKLDHPNLINVHDLGFHEDCPYLVMDYLAGRSLSHYAASEAVDARQAAMIIVKLADALGVIHAHGITHNDIKPANVLMSITGEPVLVDFGLASRFVASDDGQDLKKPVAGTLSYMAPEQARGESSSVDIRTDVFALGATLHFLLTQKPPFAADDLPALISKVERNEIDKSVLNESPAPSKLRRICWKAMASSPEDRYSTPAAMANELQRWADSRNWSKLVLMLSGAVLMLAILFMVAWPTSTPSDTPDPLPVNPELQVLERPAKHDFPFEFSVVGHDITDSAPLRLMDGQTITFRIEADRDCYVGIWHLDVAGAVTQLFPNDLDQDGFVEAGTARIIPERDYSVRLSAATDTEYVYAAASTEDWATMSGSQAGPYSTFTTPEQIAQWQKKVRGAALVPHEGARIAEKVLAIEVSAAPEEASPKKLSDVPDEANRDARLLRRERLLNAAQSARADGKLDDAAKLAQELLDLELSIFGAGDPVVIDTIQELIEIQVAKEDLMRAAEYARQLARSLRLQHGAEHWRSQTAEQRARHYARLAQFTADERTRFEAAELQIAESLNAIDEKQDLQAVSTKFAMALTSEQGLLGADNLHVIQHRLEYGELLDLGGDSDAAEAELSRVQESLSNLGITGHPLNLAAVNRLGQLAGQAGRYRDAARRYHEAVDITHRALGASSREYLVSLINLATVQLAQNQFSTAQMNLLEATRLAKSNFGEGSVELALALNNLGGLYQSVGNLVAAEQAFAEAYGIRRGELGETHSETLVTQNNLAGVQLSSGNYEMARGTFQQLLSAYNATAGDHRAEVATTLSNLAATEEAAGDFVEADQHYRQALTIREDRFGLSHPLIAASCNNLGMLSVKIEDFEEAEGLLRRALDVLTANDSAGSLENAITLNNFAVLRRQQALYPSAAKLYEQALFVHEQLVRSSATSLPEQEQLSLMQQLRTSLDGFLSVSALAKVADRPVYQRVLAWKGRVFLRQQVMRQRDSNPRVEELFQQLREVTQQLATLALSGSGDQGGPDSRAEYQRLYDRRQRIELQLSSSRVEVDSQTVDPISSIQQSLEDKQVLIDFLEYWRSVPGEAGDSQSFTPRRGLTAFVVRKDQPVVRCDLGDAEEIHRLVTVWRRTHGAPGRGAAAGISLRERIWEPIAEFVNEGDTILVSPDGPMALVPLAALPGSGPETYLIEEHAFAIVPVAQLIASNEAKSGADHNLLLVGDVDFGKSAEVNADSAQSLQFDFAPLENSRSEILSVRDSHELKFEGSQRLTLRKKAALESRFREEAAKFRYIHIASHGFAVELTPSSGPVETSGSSTVANRAVWADTQFTCGVAFSGANNRARQADADGILTAAEVVNLDLREVDLAVLSACDTGRGTQVSGEGMLSLQRAFQIAGARSVVATLWKVDDLTTRRLIERFYENMWDADEPITKLEALRQAQLAIMRGDGVRGITLTPNSGRAATREHLPPFHWAAFTLSGDWH